MWVPHWIELAIQDIASRLGAISESLNEQANAKSDEQSPTGEKQGNKTGVLRAIAHNIKTGNDSATTAHQEDQRQQRELISAQWWTVRWTAGACVAASIYALIAAYQGCLMHRTYTEIQKQTKAAHRATYMACLSAQAAQAAYVQSQNIVADTHAATASEIRQTNVQIETERAIVVVDPKMPRQWPNIDQPKIPLVVENFGKSNVISLHLWIKAVMLDGKEKLSISYKGILPFNVKNIYAGKQIPDTTPDPGYPPNNLIVAVWDANGKDVKISSGEFQKFLAGDDSEIIYVFGHYVYSDFSGTYKGQFCVPRYLSKEGFIHRSSSPAENTCFNYDKQNYAYSGMTGAYNPSPPGPSQINLIDSCVEPKD